MAETYTQDQMDALLARYHSAARPLVYSRNAGDIE
jgi:hypothetical protein